MRHAVFWLLLKRDLLLAIRSRQDVLNPLLFFILVITLFPLGISPEKQLLSQLAVGLIWVIALLTNTLVLERIFRRDYEDGFLDQILLSRFPLWSIILVKLLSIWLTTGFLITLIAPLLAYSLFLPAHAMDVLMLTLLLGTPILTMLGAVGAALTLNAQGAGVLVSLIILPLYVPILILATSTVNFYLQGLPIMGHLLWLAVMLVAGILLTPFTIAAAIRANY